jgi:hypothetical protein
VLATMAVQISSGMDGCEQLSHRLLVQRPRRMLPRRRPPTQRQLPSEQQPMGRTRLPRRQPNRSLMQVSAPRSPPLIISALHFLQRPLRIQRLHATISTLRIGVAEIDSWSRLIEHCLLLTVYTTHTAPFAVENSISHRGAWVTACQVRSSAQQLVAWIGRIFDAL